ncbi:MAG: cytochrome c [Neomegalonema sp.]|nr:cytochrome c [Neomegalonema sp.]
MKRFAISALIAATAFAGLTATAQADAEQVIKARQGYYQMVLSNFGPLVGMAKGQVDYDAATAQKFADNIAKLGSLDNGHLWLPGTDNEAMAGKTRALPAIWQDGKIGEKAMAFKTAVTGLQDAAGQGLDALRPAVGALGNSCKGCHESYRAENF